MLSVQGLGLHHSGNYLFRDVNFTIKRADKIGLVGKNGAGKSTLLKILSNEINFYEGNVVPEGNITIGILKQDLDFVKGRSVWDETMQAFEQINKWQSELEQVNEQLATRTDYESEEYTNLIHRMTDLNDLLQHHDAYNLEGDVEKVLLGLGFKADDFNKITDTFSGGWRMRIELAKLLLQNNDLLLLDEPTNHLDMESIIWLENFLKDYSSAIVLVSHDKQFMTAVCNRTFDVNNKKIDDYKANYSKYLELRKERREKLMQAKKNQDAEIKQMEDNINKFRASATKASFAQSLIKKLEKIERIEIDNEDVSKFNIRFEPSITPGKVIFEAENLGKSYGDKQVFDNVNFFVERGDRIALLGQNGQGKTTLAKILAGEIPAAKVYEDEQVLAFLDISQVTPGHTLVVPKEHYRNLLEMDAASASQLFAKVPLVAQKVMKATQADGMNIIANCEEVAGQTVFHTHVHLVPRYSADDDLKIDFVAHEPDFDKLAQVAETIKNT